ncbi:MAG: cytochrome c family protein [Rhodospirillales bacterium]
MDSFELNKVAGAVLAAALFMMVVGKVAHGLVEVEPPSKPVFAAVEPSTGGGETATVPADTKLEPVGPMLAKADPKVGEATFVKRCGTCHTTAKGGPNKTGPDLWNIVGRARASHEGFTYSSAMQAKGGSWDYESINEFISNPQGFVKGTKMALAPLRSAKERTDIISFLRTQNDSPPPLPQ